MLQSNFITVKCSKSFPMQISVHYDNLCFLLFTSGQCRIMGKGCFTKSLSLFDSIVPIISSNIITPLYIVSHTITSILPHSCCPLNLHVLIRKFYSNKEVLFEPELFPAICITQWDGCHVNVFSSGKIIVLGKNSLLYKDDIYKWILHELCE